MFKENPNLKRDRYSAMVLELQYKGLTEEQAVERMIKLVRAIDTRNLYISSNNPEDKRTALRDLTRSLLP